MRFFLAIYSFTMLNYIYIFVSRHLPLDILNPDRTSHDSKLTFWPATVMICNYLTFHQTIAKLHFCIH